MDALEAIRKRRSVRKYTGDSIPRQDLETIVDAARLAPSGHNRQPWEFIVITDRAMITQLAMVARWMNKSGATIAVVMDPTSKYWLEDASAAIENMLIASTALGHGSCWVEGESLIHEEHLKNLLNIPAERRLIALITVGVPLEWPTIEKKPLEAVLHWEMYSIDQMEGS
jgi:nitroreductase